MRPSLLSRAAHKPLIQFVGPRASLWKGKQTLEIWVLFHKEQALIGYIDPDAPHHSGPHPLTPKNLEKHVAKAQPEAPKAAASQSSKGVLEFSQLPARYRRIPISDAEMEAIEVRSLSGPYCAQRRRLK